MKEITIDGLENLMFADILKINNARLGMGYTNFSDFVHNGLVYIEEDYSDSDIFWDDSLVHFNKFEHTIKFVKWGSLIAMGGNTFIYPVRIKREDTGDTRIDIMGLDEFSKLFPSSKRVGEAFLDGTVELEGAYDSCHLSLITPRGSVTFQGNYGFEDFIFGSNEKIICCGKGESFQEAKENYRFLKKYFI